MRSTPLAAACVLGLCAAGAQAQSITFTNANGGAGQTVPLAADSALEIDALGNVMARCVLQGTTCSGTGASGGTGATVTLARSDTNVDVTAGETVELTWSSTGGDLCRATSSGPATTWSGLRAGNGSETIAIPSTGVYGFSLSCYALAGGEARTITVTTSSGAPIPTPPPPPPDTPTTGCPTPPDGWARVQKSWKQAFSPPDGSPSATYPGAVAFPTPIGADKGTYLTVAFTPNANESVVLYFDQIQARLGEPYTVRPADGMFFAISPCPGDLRPAASGVSEDPFLQHGCRKFENSGSFIFSSKVAASDYSVCKVEAGQTYYLHVMAANPTDGLTPGEHSCAEVPNSAGGCDVGIVSQVSH